MNPELLSVQLDGMRLPKWPIHAPSPTLAQCLGLHPIWVHCQSLPLQTVWTEWYYDGTEVRHVVIKPLRTPPQSPPRMRSPPKLAAKEAPVRVGRPVTGKFLLM